LGDFELPEHPSGAVATAKEISWLVSLTIVTGLYRAAAMFLVDT
jgi:hypothetical protein